MHTINHTMENSEKRDRAMRRVQEEKSFYSHFGTYVFVILGLFILNQVTSRAQWWYWPAIGWGIGIAAHFSGTFGFPFIFGKRWEDRRIKKLMDDDKG